jgi:nucleoside phosphorylase
MLLEVAVCPATLLLRSRSLPTMEGGELRDAVAQGGLPWGRLLHDWALEHGNTRMTAAFGPTTARQPARKADTIDITAFYLALGEIGRWCPLEFSMPSRPRGSAGPIDTTHWPGNTMPRMPRTPSTEVQLTNRTAWQHIALPTTRRDWARPRLRNAAITTRGESASNGHTPIFGLPSIGEHVGEFWVRLDPTIVDRLKTEPVQLLDTLIILGEARLEFLRDRAHEQQDQFDQKTLLRVNEHLKAATGFHTVLADMATRIAHEPDDRKRAALATRIFEAFQQVPPARQRSSRSAPQRSATNDHRRADVLVITALDEERDALLHHFPNPRRQDKNDETTYTVYETTICTQRQDQAAYRVITTSLSGMGPLDAAIRATDAAQRWHPRIVLVVGIAGGVASEVALGDVLIATSLVDDILGKAPPSGARETRWHQYTPDANLLDHARHLAHDWARSVSAKRPQAGTPITRFGDVLSGGNVVASAKVVHDVRKVWPKLAGIEMEGGGVASALQKQPYPSGFLMIRGISDIADASSNARQKRQWRSYAADVAATFALALLRAGPLAPQSRPQVRPQSRRRQNTIGRSTT